MTAPEGNATGLTEQQALSLSVAAASVALSAGAGCGKTTVLTARFLGDLDGPEARPLGAIVALTFTEKAARELRQRIRHRCREQLRTGSDPVRWRGVLRGLEAAPIGTFHEFCAAWIRRYAVEAGVDPDFAILDAAVAGTIRDEALARSLRRGSARDPDLVELAVEFGLGRVRQALADLLAARAAGDLAEWELMTPEEVVAVWRGAWEREGRTRLLRKVVQAARPCLELLDRPEGFHAKMAERRAFLRQHLPALARDGASEALLAAIREQAKVQGAGTKAQWPSPELCEDLGASLTRLRKAIDDFVAKAQWDEAVTLEAAEHGLRFARLAAQARQEYDRAKRARGGLDFDDLLLKARDLLRAHVESELPAPFAPILVDEFQDTDPIQGEVLTRLAGAEAHAGRLFLVGDVKQSIYRFRGAQPRIFEDFRATFPAEGRQALTENFRSVPALLDFINALFAETFPGAENVLSPRRDDHASDDQPAVEFLWATEADGTAAPRGTVHDRRLLEARWLARRLRERLEGGWMVRDRQSGELRQAHPGDVAFLFRAMTDVGPYESALDAEGFDYYTVGGAAFYVQQEIQDLVNVLSAVEDPFDPVALAGALRSPFFGLSDDGLYWLATSSAELASGLEAAGRIGELGPLDRARAERARALLTHWRTLKDRLPIAALVDRVLDESGYEAALLGESLGARRRANARKLVRLARQFDQQGGFTLAAFVRRLRADLRRPPREEQAATTDEEGSSVRLLSIHQAKGLEFPIVVLPDLNRKPPGRLDPVAFDPLLGPLVRPSRDPGAGEGTPSDDDSGDRRSLGWLTYDAIERCEDEDEALRLFYVAATRARDSLILSAGVGPAEKALSPALLLLDERFDRSHGHLRVPLPVGWRSPAIHITRSCPTFAASVRRPGVARTPLNRVAEVIERADIVPEPAPRLASRRPRFVDLDPTWSLAPTAARLDRLVRAMVADPRIWGARDWAKLAAGSARKRDPLVPARLVDEALARLERWVDGPIGRALAGATTIVRSVDWIIAWPPDGPEATVFQGRFDLAFQDRDGVARVVIFGDAGAAESRERLRLLLSAKADEGHGLGPIREGWRIRHGPGGGLSVEDDFSVRTIDALFPQGGGT